MLGQFLEISVPTEAPAAGLEAFAGLGFRELATSHVLTEPYVAVWDGRVAIGLHDDGGTGPRLAFVRPELESFLHAFRHAGLEPVETHLTDDEFHTAVFVDPNGQAVVLYEARTFSPAVWEATAVPALGEFVEYSLATASLDASLDYWQRMGLKPVAEGDTPHRWARLAGNGLTLGLHARDGFEAGPTFRAHNFDARCDYLRALGQELRNGAPVAGRTGAVTLATPVGLPVYLVE